jgi:xylan 1,4-beta-xylosidase
MVSDMIMNPILPGFNPDPCICRKGEDYYLAVSTFEWLPGIPIYHSRDLKNWELYSHVFSEGHSIDLRRLPSAKGIWAPCLTYCEEEDLFYVVYGVMNSMNARYFDVDNYLITAKDLREPWSEPVYLHSAGFDASLFHDRDGRKYVVSLDWETRAGYEKPGVICLAEYDPEKKEIIGYPKRVWKGGTDRGCIEGPHLYRRGDYYYMMCAEGGTGYNHCVTMGRAESVWGPYERDPENPILTSAPGDPNERRDPDHLKLKYYNPDCELQKAGHGSVVETQNGETWMVYLCARPFVPQLRCTLGRETAIQRMRWTKDGWLRTIDGSNLARLEAGESALPEVPMPKIPSFDDFDREELGNWYYAPRILP